MYLYMCVSLLWIIQKDAGAYSSFSRFNSIRRSERKFYAGLIEEDEVIMIFGRLADDMLLLDVPGAGTPEMMNCCHGGCDNCAFSHIFDNMSAGRPKWVAAYPSRRHIDGRYHVPPWMALFTLNDIRTLPHIEDDDPLLNEAIDEDVFIDRLNSRLEYRPTLGPSKTVSSSGGHPSRESLKHLFNILIGDESAVGGLSPIQFASSLRRLFREEHGVAWDAFKKKVLQLSTAIEIDVPLSAHHNQQQSQQHGSAVLRATRQTSSSLFPPHSKPCA